MKTDANDLLRAHGPDGLRSIVDATTPETLASIQGPEELGDRTPAFSDEALALRFAERHADHIRFVSAWNKWMILVGTHWQTDATLHAFNLARRVCRDAAAECIVPKVASAVASAKTVYAVERLSRADQRLAATVEQWDADPWLLNTPDGVVDLRTGALRRHPAADYMTKMTEVGPRGACPKWRAFLDRITGGDEALIAYLQRVCGYCLTGDTSEQSMFFAYGIGANGKGVFLQTVGGILADYCKTAAIETFAESKTDRHPTELARLHNARLVTATETEGGRHWAESRLKLMTGGDTITAHFMRQDDFEYVPRFKLFFSGNHKPRLRSVGVAMRRRINMIPFAVTISEEERDPQLADTLKAEWPGILKWMLDGCIDWQIRGLELPEAVTRATDAYFACEDGYADWIADRSEIVAGVWSRSSELFASWRDWAEKSGQPAGDTKRFREEMERLGFAHKHTMKGNFYVGLRIRQDPPARDW
jgi:putative DNA primase/helicase